MHFYYPAYNCINRRMRYAYPAYNYNGQTAVIRRPDKRSASGKLNSHRASQSQRNPDSIMIV